MKNEKFNKLNKSRNNKADYMKNEKRISDILDYTIDEFEIGKCYFEQITRNIETGTVYKQSDFILMVDNINICRLAKMELLLKLGHWIGQNCYTTES